MTTFVILVCADCGNETYKYVNKYIQEQTRANNVLTEQLQHGQHTSSTNFKNYRGTLNFFLPVALRPNAGHGLLTPTVSRSHNHAQQSVRLLLTSDQLIAETST